jgi:hypothetical protein
MADISRSELQVLKGQIEDAVASAVDDDVYAVSISHSSYGYIGKVTLEIVKREKDGTALSKKAQDFLYNAEFIGLEKSDLGAVFMSGSTKFRITGFNIRAKKYPIASEHVVTGAQYKHGIATITQAKHFGGEWWTPAS